MAWAYRTGSYGSDGLGFNMATSTSFALGAAVSAGDRIIVLCVATNNGGTGAPSLSVADNLNTGKAYTEDRTVTIVPGDGNYGRASIFSLANSAAGTPTITVTVGTTSGIGQFGGAHGAAYSGLLATDPGSDTGSAASATSSSPSSGATGATTNANELVIGSYADMGYGMTLGAGTGFTLRGKHDNDSANWQGLFEDQDSGASGSTPTATATVSTSSAWGMLTAVYKLASGGATANTRTVAPVRYRLQVATAWHDTLQRFKLRAQSFRDTASRLSLKAAALFRDSATRFRLQVTNQNWRDTHQRLGLKSVTSFKDTLARLRIGVGTGTGHDTAARFKLTPNPINGALRAHPTNSRVFTNNGGRGVLLAGAHTWDDVQDQCTAAHSAPAFDFNAYIAWLRQHGLNCTILWRNDMVRGAGYLYPGPTWYTDVAAQWPWQRNGPGNASDGDLRFDLTAFNQPYFDRLRALAITCRDNGIYAIIDVYDACNLAYNRSSVDGFPFTDNATGGQNNINGVDDGYTTGTKGVGSVSMTSANAITAAQDRYVEKLVDTLNDLDNIIWQTCEEVDPTAKTYWAAHMIDHLKAYEAGKPSQHPVGMGTTQFGDHDDAFCLSTNADWVAVGATTVPLANNQKVVIQDSDHSAVFGNSAPGTSVPGIWENLCYGAGAVLNMDGYITVVSGTFPVNSPTGTITNGLGTGPDPGWNPVRDQIGWAHQLVGMLHDIALMTPQPSKASTGYALVNAAALGFSAIVYAPSGGSFTLDLSSTSRSLQVYWFNPATLALSAAAPVSGGSTAQSFTPPWGSANDAVLLLQDPAGWSDTATRFRLITGGTHDTHTRFKLLGQRDRDTPARLRLGAVSWRDSLARLRLLGAGFRDSQLHFQLQAAGTGWRDSHARLRLQSVVRVRDTLARFIIQPPPHWRDTALRLAIITRVVTSRDTTVRLRIAAEVDTGTPPPPGTATSTYPPPPLGEAISGGPG